MTAPSRAQPAEPAGSPLARVTPRHSVDYAMRTIQQNLNASTAQADLKASIVITTSSIVLSIAATQWNDPDVRWGLGALGLGVLGALVMAVVAVYPKYSVARTRDSAMADDANPLFFGHVAAVTKARYQERIAEAFSDDERLYEALTTDIYEQSWYLLHAKFRYLKVAYTLLLAGFVAAPVVQAVAGA